MRSALTLKILKIYVWLKENSTFQGAPLSVLCPAPLAHSQQALCYLAELLSYIQHSLSKEVLHHHLIEKPLTVCLPAAVYSHTANVRIKILKKKKTNHELTRIYHFIPNRKRTLRFTQISTVSAQIKSSAAYNRKSFFHCFLELVTLITAGRVNGYIFRGYLGKYTHLIISVDTMISREYSNIFRYTVLIIQTCSIQHCLNG